MTLLRVKRLRTFDFAARRHHASGNPLDGVIDNAALRFEGGMITAIGPAAAVTPLADEPTLDFDGTITPGLIDAHTHICLSAGADPVADIKRESPARIAARATLNLRRLLSFGVTCIRDMGGPHGIDLALQDAVDDGLIIGPRVLASGWAICITGGHGCGWFAKECDGPDAVRTQARKNLKHGARHVKVVATGGILTEGVEPGAAQMTEGELRAAVEEAHARNVACGSHAQGTEGILRSLRAQCDTIEHGFFVNDDCLRLFLENDAALVPTFTARKRMEEKIGVGIPTYIGEKIARVGSAHDASFALARDAGVTLVCGTDAGTPFNRHGDIASEIHALIERGITPQHAIAAATCDAARAIRRPDLGRLAVGLAADLVGFTKDPVEHPAVLSEPALIIKAGTDYTWLAEERRAGRLP